MDRAKAGMSEAFDLVILGGGCAGLSLSMALTAEGRAESAAESAAEGQRCPRTLIVESRTEYTNDRTWCCWSNPSALVPYRVRRRWRTMRVAHGGQSVSLGCGMTPYQMVEAQDFYAAARSLIDQQPDMALWLGTSVIGEPTYSGGVWNIRTSSGNVTARSVVDTRPPRLPRRDGATLWQSFYGWEIECGTAIFDPSSIDLMNFLAPDALDVAFVYVLPVTATRALVEVTVFGAEPLAPRELAARLDAAVAQLVRGASFKTLRREHGILPMGLNETPRSAHSSFVNVGVMAGGARPSTGYAFQRIQRWAGECASALVSRGHPVGHQPDALPLRLMDQIFLDVLRADPSRGGAIFFSLFSRADTARVIRFLSGNAGVVDSLAVVAAMPVLPFVKAALALTRRRGRISEVQRAL